MAYIGISAPPAVNLKNRPNPAKPRQTRRDLTHGVTDPAEFQTHDLDITQG